MRTVVLLNGLPNVRKGTAGFMHGHRVTRDIDTDGSTHAMGFPCHFPFSIAICDKAIVVVAVAKIFAAAIAWNVREHLRMVRREGINGSNNFHWPRRWELKPWERRKIRRWKPHYWPTLRRPVPG